MYRSPPLPAAVPSASQAASCSLAGPSYSAARASADSLTPRRNLKLAMYSPRSKSHARFGFASVSRVPCVSRAVFGKGTPGAGRSAVSLASCTIALKRTFDAMRFRSLSSSITFALRKPAFTAFSSASSAASGFSRYASAHARLYCHVASPGISSRPFRQTASMLVMLPVRTACISCTRSIVCGTWSRG